MKYFQYFETKNFFYEGEDEKIYCIKCNKVRKFKNPKISYILDKTLVLSTICHKYGSNDKKYI